LTNLFLVVLLAAAAGCGEDESSSRGCEDQCQVGQTGCSGPSSRVECVEKASGCLGWSEPVECEGAVPCIDGQCEPGCQSSCPAGESVCEGSGSFRICEGPDAKGCYALSEAVACDAGTTCARGVCVPGCADACTEGERQCVENGFRLCEDLNSDGCLEWGEVTACPAGQSCSGGECSGTCRDECAASTRTCDGKGFRVCGNFDEDECIEWGDLVPCAEQEACSNGSCSSTCSNECAEGGRQCAATAAASFQLCGQHDSDPCLDWGEATACAEGQTCSFGECVQACANECAEGESQCAGPGRRTCGNYDDDDCLDWSQVIACDQGQTCSAGTCSTLCSDECAEGTRTCEGMGFRTCGDFDDDDCREWSPVSACGDNQSCTHGQCAELCHNECAIGGRQCSSTVNGYQTCGRFDGDDCLDWGPVVVCEEGDLCSLGECVATCSDECAEGSLRCNLDGVQSCAQLDPDPCLEWSGVKPCEAGQSCFGGSCVEVCSHDCVGGTRACAEGGVRTCGDFDDDSCAEWGPVSACPDGQVCSFGECSAVCADECAAGSRRCTAGGSQGCGNYDNDACLEWSGASPCEEGQTCSGGVCAASCSDECVAGATQCAEGGVQRCGESDDDPCTEWGLPAPCEVGTVCSRGRCVERCNDDCAQGSVRCQGEAVLSCGSYDTDACLDWSAPVACPEGQVCVAGGCTTACQAECTPGAHRCAEGGVQSCAEAGEAPLRCARWGAAVGEGFVVGASTPCGPHKGCSAGECVVVCEDECEVGGARCAPAGGRQTCGEYDDDDCRDWSAVIPCSEGQACSNGECRAICEHECDEGAARCAPGEEAAMQTCGEHDDDDCRDWGPAAPCQEGDACTAGSCQGCVPSEEVADGEDNDCDGVVDEAPDGTVAGWCNLQWPPGATSTEGLPSAPVYGRVWAEGMSDADGMHTGIIGELGWGADGSDPAAGGWTWVPGTYVGQYENNDEYTASIVELTAGTYDYAWRFSVDGGASWVYCDRDGLTEGGYSADQAGELVVGPGVWWSVMQWPHSAVARAGTPAGPFYGQVYQHLVTEGPGQGAGIEAEVGYGPDGTDPRRSPDEWRWFDAEFHADQGNNDEYQASFVVDESGIYDVAYRFSRDGGITWTYADIDGSPNGYHPESAATLLVTVALHVGWAGNWGMLFTRDGDCAAQRVDISEPIEIDSWRRSRAVCRQIIAEVYVDGFTDDDYSDPSRLVGRMERRPVVDGVEGEPVYEDLTFYGRVGNNHEYRWDMPAGDLNFPDATEWRFYFAFSGDFGGSWYRVGLDEGPEAVTPRTLLYTWETE